MDAAQRGEAWPEHRWFQSRVRVDVGNGQTREGTVHSVLRTSSGRPWVEVQIDGQDGTARVAPERLAVLKVKDSEQPEPAAGDQAGGGTAGAFRPTGGEAAAESDGFDPVAWDKARADKIKASREAGNIHLDKIPPYVETMRGKRVHYVHDPKVMGTIRTVDNRGSVYIDWDEGYSAEKELASPSLEGKKTVWRTALGREDLKDYALGEPATVKDSLQVGGQGESPQWVEHRTAKGQTLRGVVRTGLTTQEARRIDPFAFKKDGGFFIREKFVPPEAAPAVPNAETAEPATTPAILQNRNRSTPASIQQMQNIAAQPDYIRLGPSRDFANGAPVVAGGSIQERQFGREETTVTAGGRRIATRYAVVEAATLLPSNQADGSVNASYGDANIQATRAIAGNGRVAGLQKAYAQGAAQGYRAELVQDAASHGIKPGVINRMRQPVLVRVMSENDITPHIGDESNTAGGLELSPVEQARNDATRLDLGGIAFDDDGAINRQTVTQFVRSMPVAEQGGLIDSNGQPNRQAYDRLNAAVFHKAYNDEELVRLHAQAVDPEARLVMSTLAKVAPKMARLDGAGQLDIRGIVAEAGKMLVNGRRRGLTVQQVAQQLDLDTDPNVGEVLRLFAENPRSNKAVIEALSTAADFSHNEAFKPDTDMFGAVPRATRQDVLNQLRNDNGRSSQADMAQSGRGEPVSLDAAGPTVDRGSATGAATAQTTADADLFPAADDATRAEAARLALIRRENLDPDGSGQMAAEQTPVTDRPPSGGTAGAFRPTGAEPMPAEQSPASAAIEDYSPLRVARELGRADPFGAPESTLKQVDARVRAESGRGAVDFEETRGTFLRDPLAEAVHEGQHEGVVEYAKTLPVHIDPEAIPADLAARAYAGTSHSPERRGRAAQRGAFHAVVNLWRGLEADYRQADPERQAEFVAAFNETATNYAAKTRTALAAHGRVMSPMIAGPAKFPADSNRKRSDTADRRANEAGEYLEKARKRLTRILEGPKDRSVASTLDDLRGRLRERESRQAGMKQANALLRKKDEDGLRALGHSDAMIAQLNQPDFAGRTGYADYELSNNNAEIRRLKARIASEEAKLAATERAAEAGNERRRETFDGGRVERNLELNRLQVFFDGKPDAERRALLKSSGFKWAPSQGAWQRQLTGNAEASLKRALEGLRRGDNQREDGDRNDPDAAAFSRAGEDGGDAEWSRRVERARAGLRELARHDELFQLPKPDGVSVADIAREIDPAIRVREVGRNGRWEVTMPDGAVGVLRKDRDGKLFLDASRLSSGVSQGHKLYAIAAGYAHNNGLVFKGDPNGLSRMAMVRRTENMLSSALKYGTTQHLEPAPEQNIEWDVNDEAGNLERLLEKSYRNAAEGWRTANYAGIPRLDEITFNFDTGRFEDAKTGQEISNEQFQKFSAAQRMAGPFYPVRRGDSPARTGGASVKRAALLGALLHEPGGAVPGGGRRGGGDGLLAAAARERGAERLGDGLPNALKEIFYRRGPTDAGTGNTGRQAADQSAAEALNAGLAKHFNNPSWEHAYVQQDLPDGLAEFAEAARAAFGAEVVGILPTDRRFDAFDGINHGGRNYVNLNAPAGFIPIAGHEFLHQLKKDRPDLYRWFVNHARGHYRNVEEYRDRLNALVGPGEQPYNLAAAEEELLADFTGDALADPAFVQRLAQADPGRFRQLLNAVVNWLKRVASRLRAAGLGSSEYFDDIETLREHLAKALVAYAEGGPVAVGALAGPKFSLSAMKSVDANIRRGRKALAAALTDKTTVHRAMFRGGLGWVDFVWGDTGAIKPSGRYKGAKGISHIVDARQAKDGMNEPQAIRLLESVVDAIARGSEFDRSVVDNSTRVGVRNDRVIVWLTKRKGNNAWIVTGYEERGPGDAGAGRATPASTASTASLTRSGSGAGSVDSLAQLGDEGNAKFSRQRHGQLEDWRKQRFGFGFDSLTESEARYLQRTPDADRIRDRITAAQQTAALAADQASDQEVVNESRRSAGAATSADHPPRFSRRRPARDTLEQAPRPPKPDKVVLPEWDGSAEQAFAQVDAAVREGGGWPEFKRELGDRWHAMSGKARRQALGALTVHQLVEVGQRVLPRLTTYLQEMTAMDATRNRVLHEVDGIAKDWERLGKPTMARLALVMHESTLAGVDGSEPFAPSIDLAAAAKRIGVLRNIAKGAGGDSKIPTWQKEVEDLRAQMAHEKQRRNEYQRIKALYESLPKPARDIYQRARDYHVKQSRRVEEALVEMIEKTHLMGASRAAAVTKLRQEFEAQRVNAPYFPLGRQGDYWVSVKPPQAEGRRAGPNEFHMFQTYEAQQRFVEESRAAGLTVLGHGKQLENLQEVVGVSGSFVAQVEDILGQLADGPMVQAARDAVYQLYLQTLPDLSARKHFIHRKKTPGFGTDALRAFAHKGYHDAYQYARVKHGFELRTTMEQLRDDVTAASGEAKLRSAEARRALLEEFRDEVLNAGLGFAAVQDRADQAAGAATRVGDEAAGRDLTEGEQFVKDEAKKWGQFLEWMQEWTKYGGIPDRIQRELREIDTRLESARRINAMPRGREFAADIANELQAAHAWMMNPRTAPWATWLNQLGYLWNLAFSPSAWITNATQNPLVAMPYVAARHGVGATRKAFVEAYRQAFQGALRKDPGKQHRLGIYEALTDGEELKAYEWALDAGIIERGRAMDLAGVAEEGQARSVWHRKFAVAMTVGFHDVEMLNRETTFMAAYRLARQAGEGWQAAVDYAGQTVNKTHLVYSAENRPRFMRSDVARVALQFKLYSQGISYLLGKAVVDALGPNASAQEKAEARKFLALQLGMQSLAAGALGLPVGLAWWGAQAAFAALFDDDDEPKELEPEFRQALAELLGKTGGEAVAKGPINALSPIDIHSRVGMRELWFRENDRDVEGKDAATQMLSNALGPIAGIAEGLAVGAKLIGEGHWWRGLEKMTPKAVRDPLKMLRYWDEGAQTLKGDTLVEDLTLGELIGQGLGFSPSRLNERYDENNAVMNRQKRLEDRRRALSGGLAQSRIDAAKAQGANDAGEYAAARERFRDTLEQAQGFSRKNPALGISGQTVDRSVGARLRARAQAKNGIFPNRKIPGRYDYAGE